MAWFAALAPVAGSVLGGLLSNDQGSQTQTRNIDPRIVPYIYGASGSGGLLGNVNSNLNSQLSSAQSGGSSVTVWAAHPTDQEWHRFDQRDEVLE